MAIKAAVMIASFQKMYREKWDFQLGVAKDGCVDCSGAFVYTYRQNGLSIYHGSNRIAREYVVQLIPYADAKAQGKIVPGMAAFRSRQPGQSYYDLPAEYKQGGSHYNGDLTDYNHIGLVDEDINYVLNAAHPFAKTKITDRWTHVALLKDVTYNTDITYDGSSNSKNDGKTKFGIFGWSGNSAKDLFTSIKNSASTEFSTILKDNNAEKFTDDLSKSWTGYVVQNNSNIYQALSNILSTSTGKSLQDQKAISDITTLINNATAKGLSKQSTIMMYVYTCFKGYTNFANDSANSCSDSTVDTFYTTLKNKLSSYPDDVKNEMQRAYEYITNLLNNGTISDNLNASSTISTPDGDESVSGVLTGGDGSSQASAAKYNNWWIVTSFRLGSTHLNPSDKQVWNAHKIYNELTSQGYNRASACGILGNMQTESGLSPGCLQSGKKSQLPNNGSTLSNLTNNIILGWHGDEYSTRGYGLGLIQWDSNTNIEPSGNTIASFAIRNSMLWYDGSLQLLRLKFEYEHDKSGGNQPTDTGNTYSFWYPGNYKISGTGVTWKRFKTEFNDPEKCADIFRACRERSSGDKTGNKNRRENAKYWYDYFGNNPQAPWNTGSNLVNAVKSLVTNVTDFIIQPSTGPNTDAIKPQNFKQYEGSWANLVFGPSGRPSGDTYKNSACSVTAMADIVWKFADTSVTPKTIGDLAIQWGYRTKTSYGLTDMDAFCSKCASHYGFVYKGKTTGASASYNKLRSELENGHNNTLAIIGVKGIFSNGGHFVVAWKTNGDKTCICDPGINSSSARGIARENCSSSDLKAAINSVYIFQKK